jgi:hypothetical protein
MASTVVHPYYWFLYCSLCRRFRLQCIWNIAFGLKTKQKRRCGNICSSSEGKSGSTHVCCWGVGGGGGGGQEAGVK